ncbi:MAG: hypothetical protein WKG07_21560 [Hymenobacter sp.]
MAFQLPVSWLEQILNPAGLARSLLAAAPLLLPGEFEGGRGLVPVGPAALPGLAAGAVGGRPAGAVAPHVCRVYNDKDIVFMALFALATNTTVAFVHRPTWRGALWHALACAVAIDAHYGHSAARGPR